MIWSRLAPVRTAVLALTGFTFICLAAFQLWLWLGYLAVGICCLLLEFLTNPDNVARRPAGQERR